MTCHKLDKIEIAYEQIKENDMRRFYTNIIPYLSIKDTRVRTVNDIEIMKMQENIEEMQNKFSELEKFMVDSVKDDSNLFITTQYQIFS